MDVIHIPLRLDDLAGRPQVPPACPGVRHVSDPGPLVLLVDDEHLILDLLDAVLEDGGFRVMATGNAHEAVAILENQAREIAGLVVDINLGAGIKGWDIAKRARELNNRLPVVYMSGDSAHEWAAQGVPQSQMICKPFAPAQVVVALAALANGAPS